MRGTSMSRRCLPRRCARFCSTVTFLRWWSLDSHLPCRCGHHWPRRTGLDRARPQPQRARRRSEHVGTLLTRQLRAQLSALRPLPAVHSCPDSTANLRKCWSESRSPSRRSLLRRPRVPGSRRLSAAPAARAGLRLLPAHPPRGATADRWWAGPGRRARTSRACGSAASRSAVAVGPPGRMTPESSSRQGPGWRSTRPPRLIRSPGVGGARATVTRRPPAGI